MIDSSESKPMLDMSEVQTFRASEKVEKHSTNTSFPVEVLNYTRDIAPGGFSSIPCNSSGTLLENSTTVICNSDMSSEHANFDQQLGRRWMDEKRRQALYIPSLQSDQEIFEYTLEDIGMPSVSFLEEQEFEKTVQTKDHNSNILFEPAETVNMDTGILESKNIIVSDPVCITDQRSGKEETPVNKTKQQRCDNFPQKAGCDAFPLALSQQKLETSFPAACDQTLVLGSVFGSTVDNSTSSADTNTNDDLCRSSVSPTDHFSNKENVDVVETFSDSEDPYDMQNLRDSLPKLKVMTPAHLHNEISGAFMSYSEMEASKSAWLVPSSQDSLDSIGTTAGESEHDTSFCSVDSTMTVSSVESLPKVFYDPDLHRGHHLKAVSVPALRHGLNLVAADCGRTVVSSKASYDCDRPQLLESKIKTRSYLRNSVVGFSTASRLRTPEPNPSCATSFSTSSKSRYGRKPELTLSKAMVKLVFPSPTKSSSSLNGFAVGHQRTDGFMELYSQTYGKRVRSLRTASTADDCLDSKRRCQRSTTPQIRNIKTEPRSEPKDAKNAELCGRLSCSLSATVSIPRKQASSVPRDHRLGISGATPLRSRMSVQSSESASGHSLAFSSSHHRSVFLHEPKRHALASRDNSHDVSQNVASSGPSHDIDIAESGDLEMGCRAKKRPLLSPGKVVNKRALTLSPPLVKRSPLLQKFFDNMPAVTATNVMQYSDDQMEAVTLKNTLLNRDQSNKPSNATTQQTASARPPSRLKWRADLVTVVTEGLKVPTTTATAKARKSILSVRSYVIETSSVS